MSKNFFISEIARVAGLLQEKVVKFLPDFLLALGIFVFGYLVAIVLRYVFSRLLGRLYKLLPRESSALNKFALGKPLSDLVANLVFWVVVFFFLTVATEVMGLKVVTTWLSGLTTYLPKLMAGILIGMVGFVSAGLLKETVTKTAESAGFESALVLGKITQISIITVTVVVVIGQIGVNVQFLSVLSVIVLGAFLGSMGLAFGLGSTSIVKNILACHYVQKRYEVGHEVMIKDTSGKITEISNTAVFIETKVGQVMVPASEFVENHSVRLKKVTK